MKIFIEYELNNESGKGKFIQRLTKEWDKMGVKYSASPEGCDVRLAITRFRTNWKGKTVLRIDGAHADFNLEVAKYKLSKKEALKKLAYKNKCTADNIRKSDAVIWQTHFCKTMGRHVFGIKPKKDYIIFNGASPDEFLSKKTVLNKGVLLMAKWRYRPHKRLNEMIEIAMNYCKVHEEVVFHVVGDTCQKNIEHPNIKYYGQLGQEQIKNIFSECDCMLNLAYFDWCPNAVVEALVAGLPVICADGSGVAEIVKDSGMILALDKPIPKDLARACYPPKFDYEGVYSALDEVLYTGRPFKKAEHLYINGIAKQYLEVLQNVVS